MSYPYVPLIQQKHDSSIEPYFDPVLPHWLRIFVHDPCTPNASFSLKFSFCSPNITQFLWPRSIHFLLTQKPKKEVRNGINGSYEIFFNYQRMNAKKSTLKNYKFVLTRFENYFGNIELTSITTDGILPFLTKISEGAKQSTKKLRYALISAFFNFINRNS